METKATFVNVVKEFPIGRITGYAGVGFGFATTEWNFQAFGFGVSGQDTSLAYQVKVGADLPVSDRLTVFGEYKLVGVLDPDYTAIIVPIETDSFVNHNLVVGVRLAF